MPATYSEMRRRRTRNVAILIAVNLAFAIACVFWWQLLGLFVADPIAWATWAPLGKNGTPDYFRYPFDLLWMLPLGGAIVAWTGLKVSNYRMARFGGLFPLTVLGIVFAWYYLAPIAWR